MYESRISVVHVVSDDVPSGRLRTLRALLEAGLTADYVVVVGRRNPTLPAPHAHVPHGLLTAHRLRRIVSDLLAGKRPPFVVHAWSSRAARVAADALAGLRHSATGPAPSLLWEVEVGERPERLLAAIEGADRDLLAGAVCPNETIRDRLLAAGLSSERCHLIRDWVDYGALRRTERAASRHALGLQPDDVAIVILPPVSRTAGALTSLWAALVALQVRRDLRILVPEAGRETDRLLRLAQSCHESPHVMAVSAEVHRLPAMADLALFLPSEPAPLWGIVAALAGGVPIVATATRTNTELLRNDTNAWLVRPGCIASAAARILTAIEQPAASRERADRGRLQAFGELSLQRMLDRYRELYRHLTPSECRA